MLLDRQRLQEQDDQVESKVRRSSAARDCSGVEREIEDLRRELAIGEHEKTGEARNTCQ